MITTAEKDVLVAYIQAKNERIAELEAQLSDARKRIPARSATNIGAPKRIGETNFAFFGIETDEEFEQWGMPYQEVTE